MDLKTFTDHLGDLADHELALLSEAIVEERVRRAVKRFDDYEMKGHLYKTRVNDSPHYYAYDRWFVTIEGKRFARKHYLGHFDDHGDFVPSKGKRSSR